MRPCKMALNWPRPVPSLPLICNPRETTNALERFLGKAGVRVVAPALTPTLSRKRERGDAAHAGCCYDLFARSKLRNTTLPR